MAELPFLQAHDCKQIIGSLEANEEGFVLTFADGAEVTIDQMPEAGFEVLEWEDRDGIRCITKARLHYLSLPAAHRGIGRPRRTKDSTPQSFR